MSAEINNREYRKNKLKDIIGKLHRGQTVEQVKEEFARTFGQVSAEEISQAEQALINEGMQVEEVQRLCDVHASIFEEGGVAPAGGPQGTDEPGHPAHTLKAANAALRALISEIRGLVGQKGTEAARALREKAGMLSGIDSHYKIKENLLFPYMEKYGVTAPPKVMWGVDDEIRGEIKAALMGLERGETAQLEKALVRAEDMAFKEDNILLPILLEKLQEDEWRQIAQDSAEFGFFLMEAPPPFRGTGAARGTDQPASTGKEGAVRLPTGDFSPAELAAVLNTLPLDMTFVDKDDRVRFFSQGKERAFPRTVSVLGRNVSNCHPPASVHIVEKIVGDFRSGKKDHEDFWIQLEERLIHIRYFAVRGGQGEYLGVLETTQDIAPLKTITGEKRLLDGE